MSLLTQYTTERNKPTTEWDDIRRRHGIDAPDLPPLEEAPPSDAGPFPEAAPEAPAAGSGAADDEAELDEIRAKRLAELRLGAAGEPRFGAVAPLAVADYAAEVNEAGEGVGVVVFLHKERHYLSGFTLVLLEKLARRFGDVKFLRIPHTECIPDYPDANLPTLLLYRDDELLGQCVGAAAFGGPSFGIEDVEWELARVGLVETALPKDFEAVRKARR